MQVAAGQQPAPAASHLTADRVLATARSLRNRLIDEQAETETRTRHSPDLQELLVREGFYDLLRPRLHGGLECDVPHFLKVIRELARGCMSTAWSVCLAAGHTLQAASWWPLEAQREIFSGAYFSAPTTIAPSGVLTRDGTGWVLDGCDHRYASGAPYATHFIGHAMVTGHDDKRHVAVFMAPREQWSFLDDWGGTLGLRGSGSNTVRFERTRLPGYWVLDRRTLLDFDTSNGSPGLDLYGNPMYAGRAHGFFGLELATLAVGAVWAALDEYEQLLVTRKSSTPPFGIRAENRDYATWFGAAHARMHAAEAVVDQGARLFMDYCRRGAEGGKPFSRAEDLLLHMLARQAVTTAWDVMQDTVTRTSGSSAFVGGNRLERIWRDMTMVWGHTNSILRDEVCRTYTEHYLRDRGACGAR
jgi:3-hydroxy-9,10-secoandrosta-1,3,5(10)-triene-9,17-dione monooxygenase